MSLRKFSSYLCLVQHPLNHRYLADIGYQNASLFHSQLYQAESHFLSSFVDMWEGSTPNDAVGLSRDLYRNAVSKNPIEDYVQNIPDAASVEPSEATGLMSLIKADYKADHIQEKAEKAVENHFAGDNIDSVTNRIIPRPTSAEVKAKEYVNKSLYLETHLATIDDRLTSPQDNHA